TLVPSVVEMVVSLSHLRLLGDLTSIKHADSKKDHNTHIEGIRRLLLGIVKDVRAMLVILAGQLNLLRASKNLAPEIRQHLAMETQAFYAPLANRLGIWQIKWELEDMSLRFLQPTEYTRIANLLDESRAAREQYINKVIGTIQTRFEEAGFKAQLTGRPKHIYSIWRKMSRKKLGFEHIFDVLAIRILVDNIAECYAALGIVHGLWRHIQGEFDDYIATPKANNYQSIHTAVVGPEGKSVEIQIRTYKMHEHAELGVAAHWRYKENTARNPELERRILWMRRWLEHKAEGDEDEAFFNQMRTELESNQIYVLTPQNRVIELPKGSTVLDFAYAIHSELGHACRGAKVGGRLLPLTQPLESGQTVEILTCKSKKPSRDWLNPHLGFLHTSRARNKVRHWFKQQDFQRHLASGNSILEKELIRIGLSRSLNLERIATKFNYKKTDDLLAAIGRGDISSNQILGQLKLPKPPEQNKQPSPILQISPQQNNDCSTIIIEGTKDLMTRMAKCCKPVPGDQLIGFITLGRGVTIHRDNCPTIRQLTDRTRLVEAQWGNTTTQDAGYLVDILIVSNDRKGLLRDLSSIIASEDVAVLNVKSASHRNADIATLRFTIEINQTEQLDHILSKIRQITEVIEARRIEGVKK
ncbi:(p)ppGpp synthetase, partial [Achromatium sp. WMS1]